MSPRRERIGKVIVHREKELDSRVAELEKARAHAVSLESAEARERRELERASAQRGALSGRAMTAGDWRDANEWLESRSRSHRAAAEAAQQASAVVAHSQENVVSARRALRGVEMLDERILAEERRVEERVERRLEDEIARNRVGASSALRKKA